MEQREESRFIAIWEWFNFVFNLLDFDYLKARTLSKNIQTSVENTHTFYIHAKKYAFEINYAKVK